MPSPVALEKHDNDYCPLCGGACRAEGPMDYHEVLPLAVAVVFFVVGMLFGDWLAGIAIPHALFLWMLAPYLICGVPVLVQAVRGLLEGDIFNEFTLMGGATIAAMALGHMEEAVGVMLFYSIGELVEERASSRSRHSIRALLASKPDVANISTESGVLAVNPEDVALGSRIIIRPGEKVPLDGIVVEGISTMDMSSLTGESIPESVSRGSKVFGGAINREGLLTVETTAVFADSTVGRILDLVENASSKKSNTERFITRFARRYTPAVCAAALMVAVIPPLVYDGDWSGWLYRALVLLVVSCPCALVLSVPLSFFGGIGAASRNGLLVKGGQVFDTLLMVDKVIFDKTGTLTKGVFVVTAVEPIEGMEKTDLLAEAAMVESGSNHPVARAIAAAADPAPIVGLAFREVPGQGVEAWTSEKKWLCGKKSFLQEAGIAVPEGEAVGSVVYIARDGRYLGRIMVSDELKLGANETITDLRRDGMSSYMLTGDTEDVAKQVAGAIGLDGYRSRLMPDEKVLAFRELSPDGRAAFVGEGMNDAPVLAVSGVGIAMGGLGAAASIEVADVVILDDTLGKIPLLFRIARKTRDIVRQNISFAFGVKLIVMGLGIAGVSGLWEAIFADVGVALLSVANATRTARITR